MLVRLFGSNFRSLKDPFELSMVAADLTRKEDRDRGVVDVTLAGAAEPLRLLRTAAVFGHNGSGKSTVLMAGKAVNWLVRHSSGRAEPGNAIKYYKPFVLDGVSRKSPVNLGCDVVHGDGLLRYEISYCANAIERERLTVFGAGTESVLIDRRRAGRVRGDLIDRSAANQLYVKEMQPNVAVLSKLAQHGPVKGEDSARPYHAAIVNATTYADYSSSTAFSTGVRASAGRRFAEDAEYREWIMRHLVRTADVGICDVRSRVEDVGVPTPFGAGRKRVVVSFVHQGRTRRGIKLSSESAGTKKLFNIAGDWWALAHEPVTLLADELSASLHPRLLDALVRAVNDAPPDRVRSQLIFATQDAGLLEGHDGKPPALRRDQVYFTKKDRHGASELYPLAEFKDDARAVHNIRKRYLSGLYGAIPSVEKVSL